MSLDSCRLKKKIFFFFSPQPLKWFSFLILWRPLLISSWVSIRNLLWLRFVIKDFQLINLFDLQWNSSKEHSAVFRLSNILILQKRIGGGWSGAVLYLRVSFCLSVSAVSHFVLSCLSWQLCFSSGFRVSACCTSVCLITSVTSFSCPTTRLKWELYPSPPPHTLLYLLMLLPVGFSYQWHILFDVNLVHFSPHCRENVPFRMACETLNVSG